MSQTHRILLLNGPNLNMLGAREPKHYGSISLASIEDKIQTLATQHNVKVECFQANSEEKLINKIHESFQQVDFILINPAAYTHTSVALRDALLAVSIPFFYFLLMKKLVKVINIFCIALKMPKLTMLLE